jgi:hypothetical protein
MSFWFRTFLAISVAAISVGCGAAALHVDPFIGDWKLNASRSKAIDLMKVQSIDGDTYAFDFGGGGETIIVDGTDQPGVSGTTLSVTAEGAHHWKVVRKQAGRTVITAVWKLSEDGNSLSDDFTEFDPSGQVAFHKTYLYQRTAEGRGFAGTWESPMAMDSAPSAMLQIRPYEATGLSFLHPSHVIRNVKFDGKDYPLAGSGAAEGSTSSARRLAERSVQLTEKRQGKISKTEEIELSPDLQTLTQTTHPIGQRGPNIFVFERQSGRARS